MNIQDLLHNIHMTIQSITQIGTFLREKASAINYYTSCIKGGNRPIWICNQTLLQPKNVMWENYDCWDVSTSDREGLPEKSLQAWLHILILPFSHSVFPIWASARWLAFQQSSWQYEVKRCSLWLVEHKPRRPSVFDSSRELPYHPSTNPPNIFYVREK